MPRIPNWIFILIGLLYFTAVRVDTMDVDASQYASMSSELLRSKNWLFLYDRGLEYLDKPPFLFWISALSMKVFGVNNFGYKLPSILFGLWAIYATYRLARLFYKENTARAAALILATCQGMFLMTNDIRCDTILMSWVITAIWCIAEWDISKRINYLLAGFVAIGMGMMTKGPIALMVPVFSFSTHWFLQRNWKRFFSPWYLVGVVIIAVVLLPMSIGLYQQFDLHPEKTVNGLKGVSGLRFFYWSQSFGRITGESPWKNGADMSFLLLNMLWSFLPWVFILVPAIIINIVAVIKNKLKLPAGKEFIATGGFGLAYLALGSSAYQLPHYIFVVFPLAAIICAQAIESYIENRENVKLFRPLHITLNVIAVIVVLACGLLISWVFPSGILAIGLWLIGITGLVYLLFNKELAGKMLLVPAAAMIIANLFITNYVYYHLLEYEVGAQVGRYIRAKQLPTNKVAFYKMHDPMNAINFYANALIHETSNISNIQDGTYLLTMEEGVTELKAMGIPYTKLKEGQLFKVSELTGTFLNPDTRNKETKPYYFVKIGR